MKPILGQSVHYRSKTGHYILAAKIIATFDSLWPEGVERGDVPALTNAQHVHLLVFTPGEKVMYQEFDVPMVPGKRDSVPGSCWWPERL